MFIPTGWGILLVDECNVFNEKNRTSILWVVRYEWPSVAQFTFNCKRHWSTLVIRDGQGKGHFLHSKEEVMQGDPFVMIEYGLKCFPLIR